MPLRNSDRSALGFELHVQLPGATVYTKVPNVGDIQLDSPAAPVEPYKYLDGSSSQYSGTPDPETVTCNMSFNPGTAEHDAMAEANLSGAQLPFYIISGAESFLFGNTNKFSVTTAGVVTFDATGSKPSFGRSATKLGKFGKGDCIKTGTGGSAKYYNIQSLSGTPPNEVPVVRDDPFVAGTTGNVAAAIAVGSAVMYTIVKPQVRVDFDATVTQIGAMGASPSSPVSTDQLVLSAVTAIKGRVVHRRNEIREDRTRHMPQIKPSEGEAVATARANSLRERLALLRNIGREVTVRLPALDYHAPQNETERDMGA